MQYFIFTECITLVYNWQTAHCFKLQNRYDGLLDKIMFCIDEEVCFATFGLFIHSAGGELSQPST